MKPFDNNPIDKPSDQFAYKNEAEKQELHEDLRSARLDLTARLAKIFLIGFGLAFLTLAIYLYFNYFR